MPVEGGKQRGRLVSFGNAELGIYPQCLPPVLAGARGIAEVVMGLAEASVGMSLLMAFTNCRGVAVGIGMGIERTMLESRQSMTRKANREPRTARSPLGMVLESGRWVANTNTIRPRDPSWPTR